MADLPATVSTPTQQEIFERTFSREPFKGLKAILEGLTRSRETLCDAVHRATSYEDLLAKLGYKITLTKQIHVQDSYSHVGPAGGIKAVLPYYDIPTQSSLPSLIHYDSTVTTTPKSVLFFNKILTTLKTQLSAA